MLKNKLFSIHNVIRKNSKNDNTSKMDLQLIFNGDAFNQISKMIRINILLKNNIKLKNLLKYI